MKEFYVGLHHPADAIHFPLSFISVETLWKRKGNFKAQKWAMDSGAFSRILKHGSHRPLDEYAEKIKRWSEVGQLEFAVTQDMMCEAEMLKITGLTVKEHQRITIDRFDGLKRMVSDTELLPVLQGYHPDEYAEHLFLYGDRIAYGSRVGVGSVCKRQGSPRKIIDVLMAIKLERPDLKLHGFGVKISSLRNGLIRSLLYSADSMAWSFAARKQAQVARVKSGDFSIVGGQNDWKNAWKFKNLIESANPIYQGHLIEEMLD